MTERASAPSSGSANDFSGTGQNVVQARDVHGGLHLHQQGDAPLPPPRQLPAPPAHFTNRTRELAELDQLVQSKETLQLSAVGISALAGTAGVGKTALALRWAHGARSRFPDGDLYVNLRGYESAAPLTAQQALDGFLRALGVAPQRIPTELEAQAGLYRSLLDRRRILIVLDNARTAEQVRPLLPGSPTCHVLVTSRSRLSSLAARDGAHRMTLDMLTPTDSVALLRQVLGDGRVDREPDAARDLARHCGYLPLALRIAAERAAASEHLTLTDLNDELDAEQGRLDALTADDEDTAVRAVFSWSYRALGQEEARLFRLLGLHPGRDIATHAAAALAGNPLAEVRRELQTLAGAHLIEQTARDRYEFHDLLRDYAAERARSDESSELQAAALSSLYTWYVHTAHAANRALAPNARRPILGPADGTWVPLEFADGDSAESWFEAECDNVLDLIRVGAPLGQPVSTWKLVALIYWFVSMRGRFFDCLSAVQIGLQVARSLHDRNAQAWLLEMIAVVYTAQGRYQNAAEHFDEAILASREANDRELEGWCQHGQSVALRQLGLIQDAIDHAMQALRTFDEIGDDRGRIRVYLNLAISHQRLGNIREARDAANNIIVHGVSPDDFGMKAAAMAALGCTYKQNGDFKESIDYFRQALQAANSAGQRVMQMEILLLLGEAAHAHGLRDEARQVWRQALVIEQEVGASESALIDAPRPADIRARLAAMEADE
jgi:tetratricopeptide (TPR) repeat protein